MKKSKKLTKKDMKEIETNPLKWLANNCGREIEMVKPTHYYLIKTDARPIQLMDSDHVIGGKRYQGEAVELTKQQIEWTIKLLEATKDVIDCDTYREKLERIIKNEK